MLVPPIALWSPESAPQGSDSDRHVGGEGCRSGNIQLDSSDPTFICALLELIDCIMESKL